MPDDAVRVEGLDEFRKEIRKLKDDGLIDDLKEANFQVAELVARSARSRATGRMEQRAADTLKARRNQRKSEISLGNARTPFALGAEFGAAQNVIRRLASGRTLRGWNQFKPWRGSGGSTGYFLYPAIRAESPMIVEIYGDSIEKLMGKAFPD